MSDRTGRAGVVGYLPGAWDMFHIGHLNIVLRARDHCDYLIVGVVTDEALFGMKGKYPIIPLAERVDVVRSMAPVDEVVVDHSSNKIDAWRAHRFDVLFKGDDWRGTAKGDRLEQQMQAVGARVCYFPYTVQTSSTKLRSLIAARS